MTRREYIEQAEMEILGVPCFCGKCGKESTMFFKGELPKPVPIAEPSCYLTILRYYKERNPEVLEHFRNVKQFELTRRLQTA